MGAGRPTLAAYVGRPMDPGCGVAGSPPVIFGVASAGL
jgi:hypothetical protein